MLLVFEVVFPRSAREALTASLILQSYSVACSGKDAGFAGFAFASAMSLSKLGFWAM